LQHSASPTSALRLLNIKLLHREENIYSLQRSSMSLHQFSTANPVSSVLDPSTTDNIAENTRSCVDQIPTPKISDFEKGMDIQSEIGCFLKVIDISLNGQLRTLQGSEFIQSRLKKMLSALPPLENDTVGLLATRST